ncbi:hypothetical protein PF007_g19190 [Phytophthora fragariae]|uniref:Uncharacterized protein n=1 Tax=Phytophthora fragariae TaxID=53985 RepID=A0A6A3JI05_9STRA|nr:hypothetical protein PF003_g24529 [Phytophthora fragariae]KAE8929657.1 hypothetical protein PF009_g20234 [Phytophthora fragariae]KAE8991694.1 hypothetical protein PF011_g17843 [Phytophthora fragariae]KAE9090570.1 hypothetical protein PF007_g19190 [Phytophthora fragariae]KAE9283952.1 hypothetical protein PF001_g22613 [Phytophthora fragariae]
MQAEGGHSLRSTVQENPYQVCVPVVVGSQHCFRMRGFEHYQASSYTILLRGSFRDHPPLPPTP